MRYGDSITAEEAGAGFAAMIADAKSRGGGRYGCCSRGQCATHLAEGPRGNVSTVHGGTCIGKFPETEGQALVEGATKAQYLLGLRILGLDRDFAA